MAETLITTPRGKFQLTRPHTPTSSPLRAWSAADQLVLDELGTDEPGRLLIVNDEFGALSVGLADAAPVSWNDSVLSRRAIHANLGANGLPAMNDDQLVRGDQQPGGVFDTVVVRIPKTLSLLDYQLAAIGRVCHPETRVVGTGMARHIHRSTLALFERSLGPTTTSRATRKARLVYSKVADQNASSPGAPPTESDSFVTDRGIQVAERPGTFSSGQVDPGSALLLDVLEGLELQPQIVADLGCGNGVLSATAAHYWPDATFMLIDVSDLAIDAARTTWSLNGYATDRATFVAADGVGHLDPRSIGCVITNPPFHQNHALDPDLTDRLLADAARALTSDGVLYLVAQRHLHMHTRLAQWFGKVDVLSKHPTHVVLQGRAPR